MEKLGTDNQKTIKIIKTQTGSSPDIIIKEMQVCDIKVAIVFNETLSDKSIINDFVLEYLEELELSDLDTSNLFEYLEKHIPTHKTNKINNYNDLFYNLFSGFTLVMVNGNSGILTIETKAKLDSGILESKNEMVTKGPKDAFTENYQTNIGLIRKRVKTQSLWLEEAVVGTKSKTKIGIMYVKDVASKKLADYVIEKIKNINIDGVFDSNYIIETITSNNKNVFTNYLSTERPDLVSIHLLDGRIAIIVENTPFVIIIPALFVDFFHSPEDYYQKTANVNLTRIIRVIAFLLTILTPAIYVAISTHNLEAIPTKLLVSFSTQRAGVPLPTIIEILMMMITFEILKETDTRSPNAIGSSLSIVGAIVLGQAAVAAGIVSPITIIVVATTAISGLIASAIDIVNGVRWWRLIFLILASIAGLFGVLIAGVLFIIDITSIKSFGLPYLTPFAPFFKGQQDNVILLTNNRKYSKRNALTAKNNNER